MSLAQSCLPNFQSRLFNCFTHFQLSASALALASNLVDEMLDSGNHCVVMLSSGSGLNSEEDRFSRARCMG
jgi:hypothetical protein